MSKRNHFNGKKKAGTHTTVIDGANTVINTLISAFPHIRIQPGFIEAGIGARNQSIKLTRLPTVIQMVIITKATKQTFMIYGEVTVQGLEKILRLSKELRGVKINT